MKITQASPAAFEFACHAASCRPPASGGTGGSKSSGGGSGPKAGSGMGNAQGTMGTAKYVRSDGTPVSKDYPGAKPFVSNAPQTASNTSLLLTAWAGSKPKQRPEPAASTGASIKGGAVHYNGKQITNKITRSGTNSWKTTMRGAEHSYNPHNAGKKGPAKQNEVMGSTKAEVARIAQGYVDEHSASVRLSEKSAYSGPNARANAHRADAQHNIALLTTSFTAEKLAGIGRTSPSNVRVGRGGAVKANGKDTGVSINKDMVTGGYRISGNVATTRKFKTAAGAKVALSKIINEHVTAYG